MTVNRPKFVDSPYFYIDEKTGEWKLRDGASEEDKKELERFNAYHERLENPMGRLKISTDWERPKFLDSPYCYEEGGKWLLKPNAPAAIRREYDAFLCEGMTIDSTA